MKQRIVVVGLGWACVPFLQNIDLDQYDVCVVSLSDEFVYTPLLAQNVLHRRKLTMNVKEINKYVSFVSDEIVNVDFDKRQIIAKTGATHNYDILVLCHGAEINTFNIRGIHDYCHFLKTNEQARTLTRAVAELPQGSNVAVIGCGLTGVELIGTLNDMRKFNIYAIDALERPLITFDEKWSRYVLNEWSKTRVNTRMKHMVDYVDKTRIHFKDGTVPIAYDLAVWCGGIKKSSLTETIMNQLKMNNRFGICVDGELRVINKSDVYAMGDCAYSKHPPTAQVAYQQGAYLAKTLNNRPIECHTNESETCSLDIMSPTGSIFYPINNNVSLKKQEPFVFSNRGQIGYIGNNKSICALPYFSSGGNLVYYLNSLIHLYNGINWKQRQNFVK